ncbi:hypothetical protein C5167_051120 [Papaver somniferum]|uniref:Uncharacterized protein n=1 Tax=Papaver somniferum TaxID=3469 RepID=A0A4Y7KUM3_PAPSO|nr:hypothetical protein C5167_051120 [Papaver somniferum]
MIFSATWDERNSVWVKDSLMQKASKIVCGNGLGYIDNDKIVDITYFSCFYREIPGINILDKKVKQGDTSFKRASVVFAIWAAQKK